MGLYRRGATYWVRQRVPASAGLGDRVVRLSLRTTDRRLAAYRAAVITARVLQGEMMGADEWTEKTIGTSILADLDEAAARVPAEIRKLLWQEAARVRPGLDGTQIESLASRLDAVALQLERQPPTTVDADALRALVASAVAHVLSEQRFEGLGKQARMPWTEFIDRFKESADIKPATFREYKTAFDDLATITGNIPFSDITPVHVTEALKRRIARAKPRKERTIIAHDTQQKFITGISSLLAWAANEGLVKKGLNAAEGLKPIEVKKAEEAINIKRALSPDEIKKLYTAPVFSGCLSDKHPYTPGKHKNQGNRVWMLLLALLGGWRVGELDVMQVGDVHIEEDIMFLSLTERARQLIKDKKVKTRSSPRRVVVHPIVRDYGFDEYVLHRRRSGADSPLFGLKTSSNQLNRLIREAGIKDPQVSLHSLRHNFIQMIDESFPAQMDKGFRDRLTGHATNARNTYEDVMNVREAKIFVERLIVPPPVAALTGWTGRTADGRQRIAGA